ncbi:hypothetical protein OG612_18800 [Streptomyces sp. NBC_01527]|uniref:hypothetical protein n=1 Tax=Streptomyces sp. NBC_01527 TaxID=2903894 RepID=UPI003865B7AC
MNDDMTPDTAPPAEPAPSAEPAPPAPKGRVRRVVLAVLPAVLVLGAAGGAAAYTTVTVDSADRTVTTKVWGEGAHKPAKDPAGDVGRGRADTELSKLLLPVPEDYRLGPDMGEYGNDDEISGKKATAQMKESGRGIAGKQRRELDQRIDRLHVQGIAQRSYTSDDNDLTIEIQIVKMKDKRAVHDMFGFQTELMGTYGGSRKGPTIEGHKKAKCFRAPQTKAKLDALSCFAYDGGLSLTVNAYGTKPFSASHVADLVKDQLDHIESPGEYV